MIGWEPTQPFKVGIKKIFEWIKEQYELKNNSFKHLRIKQINLILILNLILISFSKRFEKFFILTIFRILR